SLETDAMGNLICTRKGSGGGKRLMLAAHMDEIGFVVRHISDKGFLKIHALGGFDPRMLCAQRVVVHASSGDRLAGTMMPGTKPKHMLTAAEQGKALEVADLFIDLGLPAEAVKEKVRIGDMVALKREFQMTGDLFTAKSMDDRVAVFVMIEAVKALKDHEVDVLAVATVQEEIGLRGATAAGSGLKPDLCVAIDITLANDIPGIPEDLHVTQLGQGTAIKILDGSLICHPGMVRHMRRLAEEKHIPHQMELLPMGGTDAGGVQRQHGGIPSFTLSIPTRYVHTVNETVHPGDVQASIDLLRAYIEDAHRADY
ncbi:MAG: M20/M25/M40 family metallo-hydrolase, partial [Fimbriimonadaceae bacterium]|nr:M20/M25/M40 family metallo-hydrolase [Fimbriimonadaceae bacterium]